MSLIEKLRQPQSSGISLIDKLRGLIPQEPIAQPNSTLSDVLASSRQLGEQVREKVRQPLTRILPMAKRAGEVIMSPGTELVSPRLKQAGISPLIAGGVGLGIDILAPGGGEFKQLGKSSKLLRKADDISTSIKSAKQSGKSFDEWIKGQTKILHGTTKKFEKFDTSKLATNEKDLASRNAFFFTDSLETAKSYGKEIKELYGNPKNPITIDADGKMYGDMREEINDTVLKAKKEGNDIVIIKNLSDRKDWGNYEPATHYAVIDTNQLKTRSQLKAKWNKIR